VAANAAAPAVLVSTQFVDACDAGTGCIRLCHRHAGTNQHGKGENYSFFHELKSPD
jgi:hypothetical protein